MSAPTSIIVLVAIQGTLVALDLAERYATRKSRYGGVPLTTRTLVFLATVTGIYGVLQYSGLALVPDLREMLQTASAILGSSPAPAPATSDLRGLASVAVCVIGFYVAGFWDYLSHRFISHSRWFWFTHEYHHLPTQVFVCLPGLGVRPFAVVAIFPATVATVASLTVGLKVLGYQPAGHCQSKTA